MNEEISDYTLQTYLRRKLSTDKFAFAKSLNSLRFCSVRTINHPYAQKGVLIIANNHTAKIWGVQSCKSPWACPVCTARRMSQEASKIANAIDLLEEKNQQAFMLTLGIPHLKSFTAKIAFEILQSAWKHFSKQAKTKSGGGSNDIFAKFNNAMNCKYRIRVGEFTYGENGWHPHFHCLLFVDKNKLQKVLDWEEKLSERWFYLCKRETIRILEREFKEQDKPLKDYICYLRGYDSGDETIKDFVENFYANSEYKKKGRPAAYISRDKNGNVFPAKSSQYICGWGADKELTGNIRKQASHEGHETPHQILERCYELDKQGKIDEADKLLGIYLDYALATKGKYRTRLSPSLKPLIQKWRLTEKYQEVIKKKAIERETTGLQWKTVCWFKPQDWFNICQQSLLPKILAKARLPNAFEQISEFLLEYNIQTYPATTHRDAEFIENKILNAG